MTFSTMVKLVGENSNMLKSVSGEDLGKYFDSKIPNGKKNSCR